MASPICVETLVGQTMDVRTRGALYLKKPRVRKRLWDPHVKNSPVLELLVEHLVEGKHSSLGTRVFTLLCVVSLEAT